MGFLVATIYRKPIFNFMAASSIVFNEHYELVMSRYPDGYFDIGVCDIPYGIGVGNMAYLNEVKKTVTQKNGSKTVVKAKQRYAKKDWDSKPPPQEYFDELQRVSKEQIIFGMALASAGTKLHIAQ